jgi:hypothetical protein
VSPFAGVERRLPRLTTAVLAATCATALATGGAVAVARSAGPAAQATRAAQPSPSPTATGTPTTAARTIADFLLPLDEQITRYDRQSDAASHTGALDLARVAQLGHGTAKPTAADLKAIRDQGFVRGYSRAFADASQAVFLYVYEWRTAAQAATYARTAPHLDQVAGRWSPPTRGAHGSCHLRKGFAVDSVTVALGRHSFALTDVRDGNCQTHAEAVRITAMIVAYATPLRP